MVLEWIDRGGEASGPGGAVTSVRVELATGEVFLGAAYRVDGGFDLGIAIEGDPRGEVGRGASLAPTADECRYAVARAAGAAVAIAEVAAGLGVTIADAFYRSAAEAVQAAGADQNPAGGIESSPAP